MGEARRRAAAGEPLLRWQPVREVPPPANAWPLAALATITCECARGAQIVLSAARTDGDWVLAGDFTHSFEITHWVRLPPPPMLATALN